MLLFLSAMVSGSEVAFFSLTPKHKKKIQLSQNPVAKTIIKLLKDPEGLLATILVSNNFINVAIIIISTYVTKPLFYIIESDVLVLLIQLVVITFFIFLFGELLPKIFAGKYQLTMARLMALPLNLAGKIFFPFSYILVKSTRIVNKRLAKHRTNDISMNELSDAIKLASDELKEEKELLEGIVNFSNIEVKEIMTPRMDIFAIDYDSPFTKVLGQIVESAFSRIPVYKDDIDNIRGVLFIKDVLPYLNISDKKDFQWQKIIRKHYIVPETKKINDLLTEFKTKKMHMAIVIDEYGGVNGLVTLEDVLEEIVGEIEDETDVADDFFTKIGDNEYEFNAKTSLIDFCKVTEIDYSIFNNIKGDADTIAGLILEIKAEIPAKNEQIDFQNFNFTISAADKRRIKKIKVKIKK
jgi:putative hemolysin